MFNTEKKFKLRYLKMEEVGGGILWMDRWKYEYTETGSMAICIFLFFKVHKTKISRKPAESLLRTQPVPKWTSRMLMGMSSAPSPEINAFQTGLTEQKTIQRSTYILNTIIDKLGIQGATRGGTLIRRYCDPLPRTDKALIKLTAIFSILIGIIFQTT